MESVDIAIALKAFAAIKNHSTQPPHAIELLRAGLIIYNRFIGWTLTDKGKSVLIEQKV